MPQAARARLQLALGGLATLAAEQRSRDGSRVFDATGPARESLRVYLHPPGVGSGDAWKARVDRLAELRHPALRVPTAVGSTEDGTWVIEPVPTGPTALERLEAKGVLPVADAIRHLRDVARALVALHRRGLAHGALGAEMVHFDGDGTALSGLGATLASEPSQDLREFGKLAWLLLTGTESRPTPAPMARMRAGIPLEVSRALDQLLAPDTPPRLLRAEPVLEAFDAYPTPHHSPLTGLFDRAGSGARGRRNRAVMLVIGLAGLALLLAFLFSTGS